MGIEIISITVNTPNLENMLRFYEILGWKFEAVKVDKGGQLHRARNGGIEFCLMSIPVAETSTYSKILMSFGIDDFDQRVARLATVPGAVTMMDPLDVLSGKTAIISDPDGHSIELRSN